MNERPPRRIEDDPETDAQGDDEVAEIDLAVVEAAIDAMIDAGLDVSDGEQSLHHLTALVAAYLRTVQDDQGLDDVEVGELAAELAAAAVEIAFEVEELPAFRESDSELDDDE